MDKQQSADGGKHFAGQPKAEHAMVPNQQMYVMQPGVFVAAPQQQQQQQQQQQGGMYHQRGMPQQGGLQQPMPMMQQGMQIPVQQGAHQAMYQGLMYHQPVNLPSGQMVQQVPHQMMPGQILTQQAVPGVQPAQAVRHMQQQPQQQQQQQQQQPQQQPAQQKQQQPPAQQVQAVAPQAPPTEAKPPTPKQGTQKRMNIISYQVRADEPAKAEPAEPAQGAEKAAETPDWRMFATNADKKPKKKSSKKFTKIDGWLGAEGDTDVRFTKIRRVGKGANGCAYLVRDNTDGSNAIAKVMLTQDMDNRDLRYAFSEISCMSVLQHPFIIAHRADFFDMSSLLIVMDYAEGGDLEKQIVQRQPAMQYFKEHEAMFVFLQVSVALHFVHTSRMLHRDIKAANIFLTSAGVVKLGDFGYSQSYTRTISDQVAETFCGTPCYLPPELWEGSKYSKKADVWSVGIVLFELLFLKRPFRSRNMHDLREQVLKKDLVYNQEGGPTYSKGIIDVLDSLLCKSPDRRISTTELLQTQYLKEGIEKCKKAVVAHPQIMRKEKERMISALSEAALFKRTTPVRTAAEEDSPAAVPAELHKKPEDEGRKVKFKPEEENEVFQASIASSVTSRKEGGGGTGGEVAELEPSQNENHPSIANHDVIPLRLARVTGSGETTWESCTLQLQNASFIVRSKGGDQTIQIIEILNACPLPDTEDNSDQVFGLFLLSGAPMWFTTDSAFLRNKYLDEILDLQ